LDIIVAQEPAAIPDNIARYKLLRWGEKNLSNVRIAPPQQGGMADSTLASLCSIVQIIPAADGGNDMVVPETVLGSQRHIPSLSHKGILGWQTDTLEIESLMLGNPLSFPIPPLVGVKVTGKPRKGVGFTDLALTIMLLLQRHEAKGKIVEFFGSGLDAFSAADRAAIAQMAHHHEGVLTTLFPIDATTITHLRQTKTPPHTVALVEAYAKAQGLWREGWPHESAQDPTYNTVIELGLDTIRAVVGYGGMAGTVIQLSEAASYFTKNNPPQTAEGDPLATIRHGDVLLAQLGSETTPPHPTEMIIAGLVAREARKNGLKLKPWVRATMPPLPTRLAAYMKKAGLLDDLDALGFRQSAAAAKSQEPLPFAAPIQKALQENKLTLCSVGTDDDVFDGPLQEACKIHVLASPATVIVYAIAGNVAQDVFLKPIGLNAEGKPINIRDLWPGVADVLALTEDTPPHLLTESRPDDIFRAQPDWQAITAPTSTDALWKELAPVVIRPPLLESFAPEQPKKENIHNARILAILENDVQAGWIQADLFHPPAIAPTGNYEQMLQGALQNAALKNAMVEDPAAVGVTKHHPSGLTMPYAEAISRYQREKTPMVLVAGHNLGGGRGQEWGAKTLRYLGVRAVIAQSYDPAFRHNLVRVGILPLQLKSTLSLADLNLTGTETLNLIGIPDLGAPPGEIMVTLEGHEDIERYMLHCRLDTPEEHAMFNQGSLWATTARSLIPVAV
ncbi:MAG TPA: hypothetical protein DCY07_05585, partial [Rhodospirillaceae bacterium]|nr:hypothetical protein [Rhodospirillaceae bacterium]